jgi:hypothetical protein
VAFTESIDDFFNEFAVTATWQSQSVQVIFDKAYLEGYGIAGTNTFVTVPEANVIGIVSGQSMVISSATYIVRNVLPDGTGILQVELEKQ